MPRSASQTSTATTNTESDDTELPPPSPDDTQVLPEYKKTVTLVLPGDVTKVTTNDRNSPYAKQHPVQARTPAEEEKKMRLAVMRTDLRRMKEKEEYDRQRLRKERKDKSKKIAERMKQERIDKGISINPGSTESKTMVKDILEDEEKISSYENRKRILAEKAAIQEDIDVKLGISALPKGGELLQLADDFYNDKNLSSESLPANVREQLTTEEITDFQLVFGLFDRKGKGYITAADLERVAALLGYKSNKKVFKDMIRETSVDKRGRVSFINFLQLVVKLQGDGPDPHEDIVRVFRQLDKGQKGYVTMADIRAASDELDLALSNRAMREMLLEADSSGNGEVTLDEFSEIIRRTSSFGYANG